MSEEEKEAIETIKDLRNLRWYEHAFDNGTEVLDEEQKQDLEIVLNLIKKQQKELEPIKKLNIPVETLVSEFNRLEDLEDK